MRDWIKKALALALCLAMVLSLAACGGADTPAETTPTPAPSEETPAEGGILENDEDIYMAAMGEFYDAYMAAFEAETLSERDAAGADIGILVCAGYSAPSEAFPQGKRLPTRLSTVHITHSGLALLVPWLTLAEGMWHGGDAYWVQMTLAEFCGLAKD